MPGRSPCPYAATHSISEICLKSRFPICHKLGASALRSSHTNTYAHLTLLGAKPVRRACKIYAVRHPPTTPKAAPHQRANLHASAANFMRIPSACARASSSAVDILLSYLSNLPERTASPPGCLSSEQGRWQEIEL